MNEANAMMFFLLVVAAVGVSVVWACPKAAARISGILNARSVALQAAREVYWQRYNELRPTRVLSGVPRSLTKAGNANWKRSLL